MKLSELADLPSFALLGPGFTGGGFAILLDLAPATGGDGIVFVPYESSGRDARRYVPGRVGTEIDLDVVPSVLEPVLDESGHARSVQEIRDAIAAGDVYQVNLTLRARLRGVRGAELFATLCRRQVPRFAAWVRLPDGTEFVSASPELFFATKGRQIRVEPMKGTARPGAAGALATSAKDAAELAMITDLMRNDLTRICEPRSVKVTNERRFMTLPYAVQTVSDVEGTLDRDATLRGVLDALHPGGSVTGAPKRAAMDMITALESTPRGPYCGALGYVEGDEVTCSLLIRTAARDGDEWVYGVGGGIVWDSEPTAELEEVLVKIGALR
jgi:anthranilate/para-aminobenzoate synthase component I